VPLPSPDRPGKRQDAATGVMGGTGNEIFLFSDAGAEHRPGAGKDEVAGRSALPIVEAPG